MLPLRAHLSYSARRCRGTGCGVCDGVEINKVARIARGNKPSGLICIAPVMAAAVAAMG